MNSSYLVESWINWLGPHSFAITFVFNRNCITSKNGGECIRTFQKIIDKRRLGGRFYTKPENARLRLRVVAEKWNEHPHCHGIIVLPDDDIASMTFDEIQSCYSEAWQKVVPGGSLLIAPITDAPSWIRYSSKERDLLDNALALDSLMEGPKSGWIIPL